MNSYLAKRLRIVSLNQHKKMNFSSIDIHNNANFSSSLRHYKPIFNEIHKHIFLFSQLWHLKHSFIEHGNWIY